MKIATITKGCPLCGNDIKGNYEYGLFCKKCNVIFRPEHLGLSKSALERFGKKIDIEEKFNVPENAARTTERAKEFGIELGRGKHIAEEHIEKKQYEPMSIGQYEKSKKEDIVTNLHIVASKNSTKVHLSNCFFTRNIKEDNKLIFRTLDEAVKNGYRLCNCIKSS